jgi:hypothetical protein
MYKADIITYFTTICSIGALTTKKNSGPCIRNLYYICSAQVLFNDFDMIEPGPVLGMYESYILSSAVFGDDRFR